MTSYLDRLNLRPFEKRLVVGVATLLFIVVNVWFVLPHFGDWGRVKIRMEEARVKLGRYQAEIGQMRFYSNEVRRLEGEGLAVPLEDQALHFSTAVQSQAAASGVGLPNIGRIQTRTNQFFLEQSQTLNTHSGEQQLVDFLYSLGSGNSLIRVRDLALRPADQQRYALAGNVQLIASYQKKAQTKPPAPAAQPRGAPVKTLSTASKAATNAFRTTAPPPGAAPSTSKQAPAPSRQAPQSTKPGAPAPKPATSSSQRP